MRVRACAHRNRVNCMISVEVLSVCVAVSHDGSCVRPLSPQGAADWSTSSSSGHGQDDVTDARTAQMLSRLNHCSPGGRGLMRSSRGEQGWNGPLWTARTVPNGPLPCTEAAARSQFSRVIDTRALQRHEGTHLHRGRSETTSGDDGMSAIPSPRQHQRAAAQRIAAC